MAEWLYEAGIGEARAALVDGGAIVEARIEREGTLRPGTVMNAQVAESIAPGQFRAMTERGDVLLAGQAKYIRQGATIAIRIVREAIPEPGRAKLPRASLASTGEASQDGPDLLHRLAETGFPVRHCHAHEPDHLEAAGWSEVMAEALGDDIVFPGGALRMTPTPAMTLFDVDGAGLLASLGIAAATAAAHAIVRHDIGGSVGIDFPSIQGRAERQAVDAAIDATLPQPFARTALNGFGFMQIVRPRPRASLPETLRADPAVTMTLSLLRRLEREPVDGPRRHRLTPMVAAVLSRHPDWREALDRRTGGTLILEA